MLELGTYETTLVNSTLTDAELEAQILAVAGYFNANAWQFDGGAFRIVGLNIPGATKRLADAIGKSPDYVESRAHTYELKTELDSEYGKVSERLRNQLPESYFVEVAKCFCSDKEDKHIDLGEAFDRLTKYTTGEWTIEQVRADLPHSGKDADYGKLIEKLKKLLFHFKMPVLLGLNKKQQEVALEIAKKTKELDELVTRFLEEK